MNLLILGLKFYPTSRSNIGELKIDLQEFERKFRLIEIFKNTKDTDNSLVKNKTKFFLDKNNCELNTFFEKLWNINLKEKTTKNNLSQKQKQAFKNLQENENIIIKEADKGSAIVILDKAFYKTKIQEILEDKTYYKLINTNVDSNIISKITKFCKIHNKLRTKKEKDFLTNYISITSNFYGLPRIHKSKLIKNAIETPKSEYTEIPNPSDLKFRPIVAGPSFPTSRLSKLIDILLQPLLNKIKSYIKDNIDFLKLHTRKKLIPTHSLPRLTSQTYIVISPMN